MSKIHKKIGSPLQSISRRFLARFEGNNPWVVLYYMRDFDNEILQKGVPTQIFVDWLQEQQRLLRIRPQIKTELFISNPRLVRFIVESANIPDKKEQLEGMLISAAKKGSRRIVRYLMEQRIDMNATDDRSETALIHAIRNQHLLIVQDLIRAGARVSIMNADCQTALDIARDLKPYDPELISMLSERIVNHEARSAKDTTTAMFAILKLGKTQLLADITQRFSPNATDKKGETLLGQAIKDRNLAAVNILIKNGAQPSIRNNDGKDAHTLFREVFSDILETERLLAER